MIPKIIHYCWFGNKKMPNEFKKYIKSWKKFCPDYKLILWNESNYDLNKNSFVSEAAKRGKWAFVADYLRLDVLEEFGGIYLDTDVELVKKIDNFLNYEAFAGFECSEYVNFGSIVGAVPHNALINEMKQAYENFIFSDDTLHTHTIPIVSTGILQNHGFQKNETEQEVDGFHIFTRDYFCPMNYSGIYDAYTDNTHSIHHFAATWFDKKERRKFLMNRIIARLKYPIKKLFK